MSLVDLILSFGRLKRTMRTGWLTYGVGRIDVESVAEHTYRTALIAMVLADSTPYKRKADSNLILRMALTHDLPEVALKDIDRETWRYLDSTLKTKHQAEKAVLYDLLAGVPKQLAAQYLDLWRQYRKGKTLEARIVMVADKLEMAFQAFEYVKAGYPRRLIARIWDEAEREIKNSAIPAAVKVLEELKSRLNSLSRPSKS